MTVAIEFTCRVCKQPSVVLFSETGVPMIDSVCRSLTKTLVHDECHDSRIALQRERERMAREDEAGKRWETLCPDEFRKPLKFGANYGDRKFFDRIYAWQGKTGLWIQGPPGRCKTRFTWQLLHRYYKDGWKMAAISHTRFRQRITGLMSSQQHEATKWLASLATVPILFLDDFGKGNTTPASEESLFDLLDARYANNKPVLFTSEFSRMDAAARFSQERMQGIQRRLEEMTELVQTT